MYPPSTGSQHMRSRVPAPDWLKFYPVYLREAGYYTSNNSKEDFNLVTDDTGWDDSSGKAHWKNRPAGTPFFSIFNFTGTHESRIRSVTDGRYLYIRNHYPHLPHGQYILYQQRTPTTAVWNQMFQDGELDEIQSRFWQPHHREELYDLGNDPHEINNLANSKQHQPIKVRLGRALDEHMTRTADLGFIPEPLLQKFAKMGKGVSPVAAGREMLKHAPDFGVTILKERDLGQELPSRLKHPYSPVRYWTLMQLLHYREPSTRSTPSNT